MALPGTLKGNRVMGGFAMQGNSTTSTISFQNVWVKVLGTTTLLAGQNISDSGGKSNRLTYTGAEEIDATLSIAVAMFPASAAGDYEFQIFKNGAGLTANTVQYDFATTDMGNTWLTYNLGAIVTNDYFELYVRDITGTADFTAQSMNATINGLFLG